MKLSLVALATAATFAAADNCQEGIMYCGYNLLRRGTSLPRLPSPPLHHLSPSTSSPPKSTR